MMFPTLYTNFVAGTTKLAALGPIIPFQEDPLPDPPTGETLIINTDAIISGFYSGANIILGLGALMTLIALPYGLQFALNIISGLFSKLGSIRF